MMRRVGLVGLVIGLVLVGSVVRGNNMDPAVLLAIGPDSPQLTEANQLLGRDVSTRASIGHDGRFFFFQSLDPLYLGDHYAHQLDLETYRAQRMVYPLLAGAGGLAPPNLVPWLMAAIQILAYGVGTAACARIAEQQEGSPWWGLAFPLNVGLFWAVLIGGAGVVALAAAMVATALLGEGRTGPAAGTLAAAVLTREMMIVYVVGVVLYEWYRTRRAPFVLAGVPAAAFFSWLVYISIRLEPTALYETNGGTGLPFAGLLEAAPSWRGDVEDITLVSISLLSAAALVRLLLRRPSHLVAGSVGFVVLAMLLSELVWQRGFDISRAFTPVYTAVVIATFAQVGGSASAVSGPQWAASLKDRTVQPSSATTK